MRVMIAEDNVLLREGLVRLLTESDIDVIGTSGDADKLLVLIADDPPDVAIVDIRLPPTHTDEGMKAALKIRTDHPDTAVLVLSQYVEVGLAMQLLGDSAAGAGYLLKDRISNVRDFIDAVQRVSEGGSAIDPTIVSALISKQRKRDPLPTGSRSRCGRSRNTCRASSASSTCPRPAVIPNGCWLSCCTCAADGHTSGRRIHQP
jgi:DNA-binding NarL/FixJ family response regulator